MSEVFFVPFFLYFFCTFFFCLFFDGYRPDPSCDVHDPYLCSFALCFILALVRGFCGVEMSRLVAGLL